MSAPQDTPLAAIIRDEIKAHGAMPLSRYMKLCLGHEEHGYYMTRDPFGVQGDFTTAPEISQMFGEIIGAWLVDAWHKMGAPKAFCLFEMGGGRGTLMRDIIRVAQKEPDFMAALHLYMMEMSPILMEKQKQALVAYDFVNPVLWVSCIDDAPRDMPCLFIGNEFLDALPVEQLTLTDAGWAKKMIDLNIDDTFRLFDKLLKDKDQALLDALPQGLFSPKISDIVEVSLEQRSLNNDLIKIIQNQGGTILWIDYGFKNNGHGDTLQGVKNHEFTDILHAPGEVDITTHINFSALADLALSQNMTVHGPVSQKQFLTALGIEVRAEMLKRNAPKLVREEIEAGLSRLINADQMGDLFKVVAFSASADIQLEGFK